MHRFFFAIFLLYPMCFICGLDSQEDPSPLANFEGEPSSVVNHVNVITGAYQVASIDAILPGAEPLIIQRVYCSMTQQKSSLQYGWSLNHGGRFKLDRQRNSQSQLFGPLGSVMVFTCHHSPEHKTRMLTFDLETMLDGLTNCAEGCINGRTNRKNHLIVCDDKDKDCWLYKGSGSRSYYSPRHSRLDGSYYCRFERKSNGNLIHYDYDHEDRLRKIEAKNATGDILSWAKFSYPSEKEFEKDPKVKVQLSDGHQIAYHFLKLKKAGPDKDETRYFLGHVIRPQAPNEEFFYRNGENKARENLRKHIRADGSYVEIDYYNKGSHKAGKKWIKVDREDDIYRRVKEVRAPVGSDEKPIRTHSFIYQVDDRYTDVYDAYDHLTRYTYSDNSILTAISYFNAQKHPYRIDRFRCGNKKPDEGNLISRSISHPGLGADKVVYYKAYFYDDRGNVLRESVYGNLTGLDPKSIEVAGDGYPIENGCHHHDIVYEYSQDGFNLLLKETHPNGKTIVYAYKPDTDLLISKIISDGSNTLMREFYEYDHNAVLIQTIRDDGISANCVDLKGVKERHIVRIQPKATAPCLGLPEVIEEQYLDVHSGQIKLLKRTRNVYDPFGHLIEQYHHNSLGHLESVLTWQYDEYGRVILEKNALGHAIERRYDAKGRLVFEKRPAPHCGKTMVYDAASRLIREEETDERGQLFVKAYRYDYLGNRIASVDIHGEETRYFYDEFSRLVKVQQPRVWDAKGNILYPTLSYTYDILGHQTSVADAKGQVIHKEYNIRGQPIAVHYPDSTHEYYQYTTAGLVTKHTDRNGLETLYTYDVLDRVVETRQACQGKILSKKSCLYSAFHLIQETDELGCTTHYEYDAAGRLILKRKMDCLTTYAYDAMGRECAIYEWTSPTEYVVTCKAYNALNQVCEETISDQTKTLYHLKKYAYHPNGQQASVTTYTEMGPSTTQTIYNARGLPIAVIDPEENQTITAYQEYHVNELSQYVLQKIEIDSLGNQTITVHDALGRIATIECCNILGTVIQKKAIFYDAVGNQERIVDTVFSEG